MDSLYMVNRFGEPQNSVIQGVGELTWLVGISRPDV